MKHTKSLVAAMAVALTVGAASTASAALGNVYYVTGSTAFAGQAMGALANWAASQSPAYTLAAYTEGTADKTYATTTGTTNSVSSVPSGKAALWMNVTTNGSTKTTNALSVHFIGSEGGTLCASVKTNTLPFLNPLAFSVTNAATRISKDTVNFADQSVNVFSGEGSGQPNASTAQITNASAVITFSDVHASIGRFSSVAASKLTEVGSGVAVVNFAFIAPTNFPANNISSQQLKTLLTNGVAPLSFFTGNSNDVSSRVYITGRDTDSGTRAEALIEGGYGLLNPVQQVIFNGVLKTNGWVATYTNATSTNLYTSSISTNDAIGQTLTDTNSVAVIYKSNSVAAVTSVDATKAYAAFTTARINQFNRINAGAGNGGYFSGGDLVAAVNASVNWSATNNTAVVDVNNNTNLNSAGTNFIVGYAGMSDIVAKGGGKVKALSFNGTSTWDNNHSTPGTVSTNNIANGVYPFWSVEHLYYNKANAPITTTGVDTLATLIGNFITSISTAALDNGNVNPADMKVHRAIQEGSAIVNGKQ